MKSEPGHNNPPDMAVTANEVAESLSAWLAEHPSIESFEDAKDAKVQIDRGKLCVKDLEAERKGKTAALDSALKVTNAHYREPRRSVERVTDLIAARLTDYVRHEEELRVAAALEAKRKADAAMEEARRAEERLEEAIDSIGQGELGVQIHRLGAEATNAEEAAKKAERQAVIAERDTHVKITGGFTRAASLKTVEKWIVVDAVKAIDAVGTDEELNKHIIRRAKEFHDLFGVMPGGMEIQYERKI